MESALLDLDHDSIYTNMGHWGGHMVKPTKLKIGGFPPVMRKEFHALCRPKPGPTPISKMPAQDAKWIPSHVGGIVAQEVHRNPSGMVGQEVWGCPNIHEEMEEEYNWARPTHEKLGDIRVDFEGKTWVTVGYLKGMIVRTRFTASEEPERFIKDFKIRGLMAWSKRTIITAATQGPASPWYNLSKNIYENKQEHAHSGKENFENNYQNIKKGWGTTKKGKWFSGTKRLKDSAEWPDRFCEDVLKIYKKACLLVHGHHNRDFNPKNTEDNIWEPVGATSMVRALPRSSAGGVKEFIASRKSRKITDFLLPPTKRFKAEVKVEIKEVKEEVKEEWGPPPQGPATRTRPKWQNGILKLASHTYLQQDLATISAPTQAEDLIDLTKDPVKNLSQLLALARRDQAQWAEERFNKAFPDFKTKTDPYIKHEVPDDDVPPLNVPNFDADSDAESDTTLILEPVDHSAYSDDAVCEDWTDIEELKPGSSDEDSDSGSSDEGFEQSKDDYVCTLLDTWSTDTQNGSVSSEDDAPPTLEEMVIATHGEDPDADFSDAQIIQTLRATADPLPIRDGDQVQWQNGNK